MFIHAQADEAVMEKEMSADDTLHVKGTVSAQNIFYTMSFSEIEASFTVSSNMICCKNENLLYANAPKIIMYNYYET
jgi:hypothetical protein